jgi:hypothetical protein
MIPPTIFQAMFLFLPLEAFQPTQFIQIRLILEQIAPAQVLSNTITIPGWLIFFHGLCPRVN